MRAAAGGRGVGGGDSEGLRRPVCGHMERVLRLLLCLGSLRLLLLLLLILILLLRRIRVHRPARARARRRRRVHTTGRHRHRHRRHHGHGRVRVRVRVRGRVWRSKSKRKRRTGTLESDALHRETSVSGLLRTESIDISRVRRAAPRPRRRPRGGGAGVDRRGRRAGGVERARAECLICWVGVRVVVVVGVLLRVVPLLLVLLWAVRAASVARRRRLRLRLHFFFVFARGVFFLHLFYLDSCTVLMCGEGEDEIGDQSGEEKEERRGGEERQSGSGDGWTGRSRVESQSRSYI